MHSYWEELHIGEVKRERKLFSTLSYRKKACLSLPYSSPYPLAIVCWVSLLIQHRGEGDKRRNNLVTSALPRDPPQCISNNTVWHSSDTRVLLRMGSISPSAIIPTHTVVQASRNKSLGTATVCIYGATRVTSQRHLVTHSFPYELRISTSTPGNAHQQCSIQPEPTNATGKHT